MLSENLKDYLKDIHKIFSRGDAREESYYSALERLIKASAEEADKKGVEVTTNPRKTEAGNPDFRVWDGKQKNIGYIEAKKPEIDLDDMVDSEQVKRYRQIFPNFILTNFLEFRFYRDGAPVAAVMVGRKHTLVALGQKPAVENEAQFNELFSKFFSFTFPINLNAKRLAKELAIRTRFLRDEVIVEELKTGGEDAQNQLFGFYEAFKKYLIHDLTENEFADLYAQTVTYGLFAARTRCPGEFSRRNAVEFIPQSSGILRDMFEFISMGRPPVQLEWIIDDITEVLGSVNVSLILNEFYQLGKGEDPIVHFYETFLSEYDPKTREKRGVYYTPEPVVSFIVRSLHLLLKEKFGKSDGFADTGIKVLDPAAGTLTFIAEACKLAFTEFVKKYGKGAEKSFIRNHLLKNFYAFELMMAPYAIGHLKMSHVFEELGCPLSREDERFNLYLTNTLEMQDLEQSNLPGMASLSAESKKAGKIKKETPILVILGNPPYSGHSANASEKIIITVKNKKEVKRKIRTWVGEQIENYKFVDGKPLGEKNPKWLQDDYVKFLRFAQWKIDANGEGVVGMITNHSYLDNPTFRGMRRSLMNSFNEIYLLDLHGNSLKKEKCPDGSKDENVFDIMQGVSITLLVKKRGEEGCNIHHSELWGLRDDKYEILGEKDLREVKWNKLEPKSEFYLFVPRDEKRFEAYQKFFKITDIFPVNSVGIVTSRDEFVIDKDKKSLERRIGMFLDEKIPDEMISQSFHLKDKSNWKLKNVRQKLRKEISEHPTALGNYITKILYRPFDVQYIFYHDELIERSRREVMRHVMNGNLGLCVGRAGQVVGEESSWNIIFVSDDIIDFNLFYRGGACLFPLYFDSRNEKKCLFDNIGTGRNLPMPNNNRRPNIDPKLFERFERAGFKPTPMAEKIFYYVYAVLFSNVYREKYAEFLKTDFPRIPFTSNYKLFCDLAKLGEELVSIHLLKSAELEKTSSKFEIAGDNIVKKIKYVPVGTGSPHPKESGKVFINETQYFSNIPEEVWEYQIGGYQVMAKWLKDRKGRILSLEDIRHYILIANSLCMTIFHQKNIDNLYIKVENNMRNGK